MILSNMKRGHRNDDERKRRGQRQKNVSGLFVSQYRSFKKINQTPLFGDIVGKIYGFKLVVLGID